jgi:5-methylcytosine-specific restriction endonuclease McrA
MPCNYKKDYPANWQEIRARILERDGHRCKHCGVANYMGVVVLAIAHLHHDTTDNKEEGLAALCQRCHRRHDAYQRRTNAKITKERKERDRQQRAGLDL